MDERFWRKVKKTKRCWLWVGSKLLNGYGQLRRNQKHWTAHRFSWQLHNGINAPDGWDVCHTCDVRACVRPSHLFLGRRKENMADMVRKGRSKRGSKHYRATLTESDVRAMRKMAALGPTKLAQLFGIEMKHASMILRGKSWAHVVT